MVEPPGYRQASTADEPDPKACCITCRYVMHNRCHAYCVQHSTGVNPWFVCDDWMSRSATQRVVV
jgi:hypothetical protein